MTQQQQLIAMLEQAGENFDVSEGTYVNVRGCLFIFHVNGDLKEVWGRGDYDGGC